MRPAALSPGLLRRLLGLLLGLAMAAGAQAQCATPAPNAQVAQTEGRVVTACALLEPAGGAAGEAAEADVPLPLFWDAHYPGRGGRARYVLHLPALDPAITWALFIERMGNQVELSVNGVTLATLGRLGDSTLDGAKLSRMVLLPASLLAKSGPNEIRIEATMQAQRAGGLSAVRFGPAPLIEEQFAERRLVELTAQTAYAAGYLLMGGLSAGLWWRQRDPLYGVFSLAALCGSVRNLDRVLPGTPLPWPMWGAVLAIAYACHIALIGRFVVHAMDNKPAWLARGSYIVLGAAVLLAMLSFGLHMPRLWTTGLALLLSLGLALFVRVAQAAMSGRSGITWLVLAAGLLTVLCGAYDWVVVRNGFLGGGNLQLAQPAMFLFVFVMAALVVVRYSRTLADYRTLNAHLSERVAEREAHLRDAFEALRQQQQEQAVLTERQRIMRDIHDGIGSQLVGLLNLIGRKDKQAPDAALLEEQVRLVLDEMRMAVDSLQPVHSDLTVVLATLRYRLQPRLQAAGIEIVWDVDALPAMPGLAPQAVLQIQRILLEAFTNVLKHAQATQVTVQARWRAAVERGAVVLKLSDNGVGIAGTEGSSRGHGLANMRERAHAIGAELQIAASEGGGTCVQIEWPVAPFQSAQPASTGAPGATP